MEAISTYLEEKTFTSLPVTEHFSLLPDKSTDEAQRKQLGLIAIYKVLGVAEIKEEYMGINLSATNAASISLAI